MKSTFTLLFGLLISVVLFGQSNTSVIIGEVTTPGSVNFNAQDVAATNDGGYIMAGGSGIGLISSGSFSGTPVIVKTDANGNVLWSKSIALTTGTTNAIAAVGQAVSGNYYVLIDGGGGYWTTYAAHYFTLAEFDTNGNLVWEKAYELNTGGTYSGTYSGGKHQVYQLPTGEYYLAPSIWNALYIMKTNSSGDLLWTKMVDGDDPGDKTPSFDVAVSGDGSVTCCCKDGNDRMICRLDANGNMLWSKKYGLSVYTHTKSIIETNDGNFVLVGTQGSPFVTKINALDGSIMWYNEYNFGGGWTSIIWDAYETASGELMVVCDGLQITWAKLDANGNVLEAYNTDPANIGSSHSVPYIEPSATGEFVLIARDEITWNGSLFITGEEQGELNCIMIENTTVTSTPFSWSGAVYTDNYVTTTDLGTALTAVNPLVIGDISIDSRDACATVGIAETANEAALELYPNPATGFVNIKIPVESGIIEVVSLTGQVVEQITIQNGITNVSLEEYSSGIYFVKVIAEGELIDTKKLIVE